MTRQEIISLVRKFINDEQGSGYPGFDNLEEPEGVTELLNYLDRAVDTYSRRQAEAGDIRLLKRMSVSGLTKLPEDWLKFAGNVPIEVVGRYYADYYGSPAWAAMPVKYFARLPYVTAYADNETLEYEHDQAMTVAALAAIYALNKHEFNISQDLMLLGMGEANAGKSG